MVNVLPAVGLHHLPLVAVGLLYLVLFRKVAKQPFTDLISSKLTISKKNFAFNFKSHLNLNHI